MGKAIVINGVDYSAYGFGQVTLLQRAIIPNVGQITEATIFSVVENGVTISATWSISDNTLASIVTNANGTATVTPLVEGNTTPVTLTAVASGESLTLTFVPKLPQSSYTWYIDRCVSSVQSPASLENANLVNGGWSYKDTDQSLLRGNKINRIKMLPFQAGTFNIYKTSNLAVQGTLVGSFTIMAGDIGNVTEYSFTEFTLGNSEYIVFGEANLQGGFKYIKGQNYSKGFVSKVPSKPTDTGTSSDLNFSIGFYGVI